MKQPTPGQIAAHRLAQTRARWVAAGCRPLDPEPARVRPKVEREPRKRAPYVRKDQSELLRKRAETRATVVAMYEAGTSMPDIATAIGVSLDTIRRHLRLAGVKFHDGAPRRRNEATAGERAEVAQMYADGMTVPQIARERGMWPATVRRYVIAGGVALRDDRKTNSGGRNRIAAYPDHLVERVRDLYVNWALSQAKIARQLGVSQSMVADVMRLHGIPLRSNAQAQALRPRDAGGRMTTYVSQDAS